MSTLMIDGYGPVWKLRGPGCVFTKQVTLFADFAAPAVFPSSERAQHLWLRPATGRRSHAALLRPSQLARWLRSSLHAQRRGASDVSLVLRLGLLKMGYPWLLQMSWIIIFRIQKLWYMVNMVQPIFWQTIIGWLLPLTKWAIGVPNHRIHNPKSEWPVAWGGQCQEFPRIN